MSDRTAVTAGVARRRSPVDQPARRIRALRLNSFGISVMLLVQYGLGIGVNLYVKVPDADHGIGTAAAAGRALTSQPVILALHAALGLLMLVAGVTVLVRAIRARHRGAIAASSLGFAAIIGAAVSGASFVSDGRDGASLAMALLTGVALLCYLANLLMAGERATIRSTA
jgi:hypothetical protein